MGVLFAVTIFLSALLLFAVQPLIGKYILPYFGGTPAVWTACLLFFQTVLLAGYAYAHTLARLRARTQAIVHTALIATAICVALGGWLAWGTPLTASAGAASGDPVWAIVALLAVGVGLPYFTLSATGPLAQAWFASALPGRSPYRLYALSNAGSLLALLGYPVVLEPLFGVRPQARLWTSAFFAFCILMAACGWLAARRSHTTSAHVSDGGHASYSWLRFAFWALLAACASTLLLAVTNQISQDVAVVPFLWVLPLTVYLLSFILCFDRERIYKRGFWYALLAVALSGVLWVMFRSSLAITVQLAAYLLFLFAACMVCHGELVRSKPAAQHLTAFYVAVSLGGAIGGVFVGVIAPRIFRNYWELNLGIFTVAVLASAVLWRATDSPMRRHPLVAYPLLAAVIMALPVLTLFVIDAERFPPMQYMVAGGLFFMLMAVRVALSRGSQFSRWLGPVLLVVLVVVLGALLMTHRTLRVMGTVATVRNFYGTLAVVDRDLDNPERALRYLRHGAVLHGSQMLAADLRMIPTTYYTPSSGIALAFDQHPRRREGALRTGVVGLGTGTVAALARNGDTVRFYEINPAVIAIAHGDGALFTYLRDSAAKIEVVEGDARLSMAAELRNGKQEYDLLVLDAFSGDAIPVHLITREAFELYLRHLRDERSLLAVHISNQHLDLRPVVFRLANELGLHAGLVVTDPGTFASNRSNWMLLTRDESFFTNPEIATAITHPVDLPEASLWTDDYSNLLRVVKWRKD